MWLYTSKAKVGLRNITKHDFYPPQNDKGLQQVAAESPKVTYI